MSTALVTNVEPVSIPFNLIVVSSRQEVAALTKQFGLTQIAYLEDLRINREGKVGIHLPGGWELPKAGAARGSKIQKFLASSENTWTLVLFVEAVWLKALVGNVPKLASSVWRGVESSLLGHLTNRQRNLLVVKSESTLVSFTAGQKLPHHWYMRKEKPAAPLAKTPHSRRSAIKGYQGRTSAVPAANKAIADQGKPSLKEYLDANLAARRAAKKQKLAAENPGFRRDELVVLTSQDARAEEASDWKAMEAHLAESWEKPKA